MKPTEEIKNMIKNMKDKTSEQMDKRILDDVLQTLESSQKTQTPKRRLIMKNPITKFAVAAMIIIAISLSLTLFNKSITTTAYALDQTIQASHSVRYLHIKDFKEGMEEPKEFWLEFEESGDIKNIRAHMPEWDSPSDGAKVSVWQQGKATIWFKKKKSLLTIKEQRFADELFKVVQLFDPKLTLLNFSVLEEQGLVTIEIDEPSKKSKPITVTSTNSREVRDMGYDVDRTVIFIDQATQLVIAIEHFILSENDDYELLGRTEFYDYNRKIDPEMFTLNDVPSDVMRIDQTTQEIGLEQGGLSDEEIAVKVVRQFYEALIATDYAKAGRIYGGVPAEKMEERWSDWKVIRIISISEPIPHPSPGVGGFMVPCKFEIEKDGVTSVYEPYGPGVRPVHSQPDRWNIHGGVK